MDSKPSVTAAAALFNLGPALAASIQGGLSQHMGLSPALEFTAPIEADAKLMDYRGEQVAGFEIDNETMICLPQAYELFLKNLVGGLHTVYTKLKRLEIVPRVCNVEQVRALRSLGAIQPGVNRCKLISCKDFDLLYQDCTSTSSRPGRPPKRSPLASAASSDQWASIFKKARYSDPFETKPVAPQAMPASLFQPMGLNPFLPLTAQQQIQMMSLNQIMTAAAAANPSAFGTKEEALDMSGQENILNGSLSKSSSADDSNKPLWIDEGVEAHPLNLKKGEAPEQNGDGHSELSDVSEQPDGTESVSSPQMANDATTSSETLATAAMNAWPGLAANFASMAKDETERLGSYSSSVQGLLLNVLGLIEIAAATARTQEEQRTKEKAELSALLNQAKAENAKLEQQYREECRLKKIYLKRWRQSKRAKNEIQAQLLAILEAQQRNQRQAALEQQQTDQITNNAPTENNNCLRADVL